jgi:mono/diheme cytochrome c family protein
MPYPTFNRMPKEDLLNIIAYIRTLKPIKNKVQQRNLMVPMAMVYPGKFLQPSVDGNVRPPESDKLAYGGYMTMFALCSECHTQQTPQGPDMTKMYAGGFTFDMVTHKVNSANITPDSATGIGTWTEERFMTKFTPYREEKNYNFKVEKENTYMPLTAYAGMKDSDLKAIYAYLMSLKPISNKVEKYPK